MTLVSRMLLQPCLQLLSLQQYRCGLPPLLPLLLPVLVPLLAFSVPSAQWPFWRTWGLWL